MVVVVLLLLLRTGTGTGDGGVWWLAVMVKVSSTIGDTLFKTPMIVDTALA